MLEQRVDELLARLARLETENASLRAEVAAQAASLEAQAQENARMRDALSRNEFLRQEALRRLGLLIQKLGVYMQSG